MSQSWGRRTEGWKSGHCETDMSRKDNAMFKRKATYLMQIDALVRFPIESLRAKNPGFAEYSDDDLREPMLLSLEQQSMAAAKEELSRHGLHPTRKIEGGGNVQETGTEFMSNHLGECYGKFSVAFKGDAAAAASPWRHGSPV